MREAAKGPGKPDMRTWPTGAVLVAGGGVGNVVGACASCGLHSVLLYAVCFRWRVVRCVVSTVLGLGLAGLAGLHVVMEAAKAEAAVGVGVAVTGEKLKVMLKVFHATFKLNKVK